MATTGFWLGRTGDLRLIKSPALGAARTPERRSQTHQLLSGAVRVDRTMRTARTWELAWPNLRPADWDLLYAFYDGQLGPGPYWLFDPTIGNYLTSDQASAANARGDLSSWSMTGLAETLALSAMATDGGPVSLLWTVPVDTNGGTLRLVARPSGFSATTPGWSWSVWVNARIAPGSASTASAAIGLRWLTASGSLISTSYGSWTPLTAAAWTRVKLSAAAPPTAAQMQVLVSLSSLVSAPGVPVPVHLGRAQLNRGDDDPLWHPGVGLPRVAIAEMKDELRQPWLHRASWILVEVD